MGINCANVQRGSIKTRINYDGDQLEYKDQLYIVAFIELPIFVGTVQSSKCFMLCPR